MRPLNKRHNRAPVPRVCWARLTKHPSYGLKTWSVTLKTALVHSDFKISLLCKLVAPDDVYVSITSADLWREPLSERSCEKPFGMVP